jgi:hypothetical protein
MLSFAVPDPDHFGKNGRNGHSTNLGFISTNLSLFLYQTGGNARDKAPFHSTKGLEGRMLLNAC